MPPIEVAAATITEAVDYIEDFDAFVKDAKTKAFLARVPDSQNASETEWLPDWRACVEDDSPIGSDVVDQQNQFPLDHYCGDPRCNAMTQPTLKIFWEKGGRLSQALVDSLEAARFQTACGPALPQHVYYVADNKLYLLNFLALVQPDIFSHTFPQDTDGRPFLPGALPVLVTSATITNVEVFKPLAGSLPGDPLAAMVIATTKEVLLWGFFLDDGETHPSEGLFKPGGSTVYPRTSILASSLEQRFWPVDATEKTILNDEQADLDEVVGLNIVPLQDYCINLASDQQIQHMVTDKSGRILVAFIGDGCGVHQIVYRREQSILRPRFTLIRQINPDGTVCASAREQAENTYSLTKTLGAKVKSCLRETHNKMLKLTLPVSLTDVSLKALRCGKIMVTVDSYDVFRIYRKIEPLNPPLPSRKRLRCELQGSEPPTSPSWGETESNASCSPSRRRRLGSNMEDLCLYSPLHVSKSHIAFESLETFSLEYLTAEFVRSNHFDCHLFGSHTNGFGSVCDALLESSKNPEIFVLIIVTSNMKRLEVALDIRASMFRLSLLNIQNIQFPEHSNVTHLPPCPSKGSFHEFSKAYKQGPLFICATTQQVDSKPINWLSPDRHPESPGMSVMGDNQWKSLITIGLHPAVAPLSIRHNDTEDGFVAIETDEPVRVIVDESSCWVYRLDSLAGIDPLKEGDGLLELAFSNAFAGSRSAGASETTYSRGFTTNGNLCEKSIWIFMQTKFRRVIIRWLNLSNLPPCHSLGLNLVENIAKIIKHGGRTSIVSSLDRAALHPNGGEIPDPETLTRLATASETLPMYRACPSVLALSNLLTLLFKWDKPLLSVHAEQCFSAWSYNRRRLDMCRALMALINSHESVGFTMRGPTADLPKLSFHGDIIFPEYGVAALENICLQENKNALIYLEQRRRLEKLVTLVNLMVQLCTLMELISTVQDNWCDFNISFLKRLEQENQLVLSTVRLLCDQPLSFILKDSQGQAELHIFTQSFLDLLYRAADDETQGFLPSHIAKPVLSMLIKHCPWTLSPDAARRATERRLTQLIRRVRLERVSLNQLVDFLAKESGITPQSRLNGHTADGPDLRKVTQVLASAFRSLAAWDYGQLRLACASILSQVKPLAETEVLDTFARTMEKEIRSKLAETGGDQSKIEEFKNLIKSSLNSPEVDSATHTKLDVALTKAVLRGLRSKLLASYFLPAPEIDESEWLQMLVFQVGKLLLRKTPPRSLPESLIAAADVASEEAIGSVWKGLLLGVLKGSMCGSDETALAALLLMLHYRQSTHQIIGLMFPSITILSRLASCSVFFQAELAHCLSEAIEPTDMKHLDPEILEVCVGSLIQMRLPRELDWSIVKEELAELAVNTIHCHKALLQHLELCISAPLPDRVDVSPELKFNPTQDFVFLSPAAFQRLSAAHMVHESKKIGEGRFTGESNVRNFHDCYKSFAASLEWKDVLVISYNLGFVDILPVVFCISWSHLMKPEYPEISLQTRMLLEWSEILFQVLLEPLRGLAGQDKTVNLYGQFMKDTDVKDPFDDFVYKLRGALEPTLAPPYSCIASKLRKSCKSWIPNLIVYWLVICHKEKCSKVASKWIAMLKPLESVLGVEVLKEFLSSRQGGLQESASDYIRDKVEERMNVKVQPQDIEEALEACNALINDDSINDFEKHWTQLAKTWS
eukprot:Blabericola_migrator_1__11154@NODE_653_length_7026_cov_105_228625_g479_i0_p1_GENE_NODE_653_length_7026_cov_105_228625_g479_i0NODE_653_length_7026_cov_105_228625_g479_i0_p1_ORF_typecomplete_len1677_score255_84Nucleoporin_N/PF08801_11/0_001Nucleoporin_N/PF08801_11/2_8e03_NODE_653_length_7026_cov_105_228625_g479_i019226952